MRIGAALSKAVDDPAAREVVRRERDPHAVAEHDADPRQSLGDLAFELDLLADRPSLP
jgi:hypothetical protein